MKCNPKKRKRVRYTGALAEPIVWVPPKLPPGVDEKPPEGCPPWLARSWPIAVEKARQEDARSVYEKLCATIERIGLLTDHFGIDRTQAGWSRDLALSLALQHEPDLVCGARVAYARLFERYGIDPNQPEADFTLALQLAVRHVPGMRIEFRKPPKGRLSTYELIHLVVTVLAVAEHLNQPVVQVSVREVVGILRDPTRLKSIIPASAAREMTRIITTRGNKRQNVPGPLSERVLRDYIGLIKKGLMPSDKRSMTTFEEQFYSEAAPILMVLARKATREDGQILATEMGLN